jgi:hypothetical protein
MPDTNPVLNQNGWFPSNIAWADFTPRTSPLADEIALSYDGGNQCVKHILIYPQDLYQAIVDLLGSNLFNPGTGFLDRVPPMTHPIFEWLYASRIVSVKEFVPTQQPNTSGLTPWPQAISGVVTTVPQFLIVSVLFQQPKYRVLSDADLDALYGFVTITPPANLPPPGNQPFQSRAEYGRYLEGWPRPCTEFVQLEAHSMQWLETGSGQGSDGSQGQPGPLLPSDFSSEWLQLLAKSDFALLWKKVPRIGLFSNSGQGHPINLDAALQTVNQFPIFGYPAGTLKFEGYDPRPLESPLPPALEISFGDQKGDPNLLFDVLLTWKFFDPPYDLTAAPQGGVQGNPTRGHNLGPFRGTKQGASIPGDFVSGTGNNLWYKFGSGGDSGSLLYKPYDHQQIFLMAF